MTWLQTVRNFLPQHKYAIDAKLLGDEAELAWSNLGFWQADTQSYPQACQALADHLAQAIQLKPNDTVLDLGCGLGASLQHWQQHYHIQQLSAVEMQSVCVSHIQKNLNSKLDIHCGSFLNLKQIFPQKIFDAVLCIDAAYHSSLNSLLLSTHSILKSNGRFGFHTLMLSDEFLNLNALQRLKLQALLKAADVNLQDLMTEQRLRECLAQFEFKTVQLEDLSTQVLAGFAHYAETELKTKARTPGLAQYKIQMTAKLCRTLYASGMVRYVQIAAQKGKA